MLGTKELGLVRSTELVRSAGSIYLDHPVWVSWLDYPPLLSRLSRQDTQTGWSWYEGSGFTCFTGFIKAEGAPWRLFRGPEVRKIARKSHEEINE